MASNEEPVTTLDDIRRLQALLKQIQSDAVPSRSGAGSGVHCRRHRLTEQNVVDIVAEMLRLGVYMDDNLIIDLYGKEYITGSHLEKELVDEVRKQQGRVSLIDLQNTLNVELSHIEGKVEKLMKSGVVDWILLQGDIIDKEYLDSVAVEVNEILQEKGQLTIGEICQRFALPAENVQQLVEENIHRRIHAHVDATDKSQLYTESFVLRQKVLVRGLLNAITRPTLLSSIQSQTGIPDRLFATLVEGLIKERQIAGRVKGFKGNSVFVPRVYHDMQLGYVDSFFTQNGYFELAKIRSFELDADPVSFFRSRHPKSIMLKTMAVTETLLNIQIDCGIQEGLEEDGWVDMRNIAPSTFAMSDFEQMTPYLPSLKSSQPEATVQIELPWIFKTAFIKECRKQLELWVQHKAVQERSRSDHSREKERLDDGNKGKTNNERKRSKKDDRVDVLNVDEMTTELGKMHANVPMPLIEHIATVLQPSLNELYMTQLSSVFLPTNSSLDASYVFSDTDRQKLLTSLVERIRHDWTKLVLCKRGVEFFADDVSTKTNLGKYLMTTSIIDFFNTILLHEYIQSSRVPSLITYTSAGELDTQLQKEDRIRIFEHMRQDCENKMNANILVEWFEKGERTLDEQNLDAFFDVDTTVPSVSTLQTCLSQKSVSADAAEQQVIQHVSSLRRQLESIDTTSSSLSPTDPASILHLTSLICYQDLVKQQQKQPAILLASGKFVPGIIKLLKRKYPSQDVVSMLVDAQKEVLKVVKGEVSANDIRQKLVSVKELGMKLMK